MTTDEIPVFDGFEFVRVFEAGERYPECKPEEWGFTHHIPLPWDASYQASWKGPQPVSWGWMGAGCRAAVYNRATLAAESQRNAQTAQPYSPISDLAPTRAAP